MLERAASFISGLRWRTLDPNSRRAVVSYGIYGSGMGVSKAVAGITTTAQQGAGEVAEKITGSGADPVTLLELFPKLAEKGHLFIATDGTLYILGISATQFLSVVLSLLTILFLILRFIGDSAFMWLSWKIKRADLEEIRGLNGTTKK